MLLPPFLARNLFQDQPPTLVEVLQQPLGFRRFLTQKIPFPPRTSGVRALFAEGRFTSEKCQKLTLARNRTGLFRDGILTEKHSKRALDLV